MRPTLHRLLSSSARGFILRERLVLRRVEEHHVVSCVLIELILTGRVLVRRKDSIAKSGPAWSY